MILRHPFQMCCVAIFGLLSGCGTQQDEVGLFSALNNTLASVEASIVALNERIEALAQQVDASREKDRRPDVNATMLAGQCQASLLATDLVFEAAEDQQMPRNPQSEERDQALVDHWRKRYAIDGSAGEAASAAAILDFLEKHRTFGVTESADDDALRTEALNRLHDACEAMRLVLGEPVESSPEPE